MELIVMKQKELRLSYQETSESEWAFSNQGPWRWPSVIYLSGDITVRSKSEIVRSNPARDIAVFRV